MSVIYQPRGKAREYAEFACNLYSGCDHGCTYCYAPSCMFKRRSEFVKQTDRNGILERIQKEAPCYSGKNILLCFTCDPYSNLSNDTTRKAIQILHQWGASVTILTKGGSRSLRDIDLFGTDDVYAATLTFDDDEKSKIFEPNAALPEDRIKAIEAFHDKGIKTWVSFEPVIDTEAVFRLIEKTKNFVDLYKIGIWSYDKRANDIDWKSFGHKVIDILNFYKKNYFIKRDLKKFL